jgi:EF-P beta-lysylation protein EpmB
MIPITDLSWQSLSWQEQLQHSIRRAEELLKILQIDAPAIESDFPVNVPLAYLNRIEAGNIDDPLLKQVLTNKAEFANDGVTSPLQEEAFSAGFGLIQKYQGRVLVVTTGACAINCRYCFRRHFPYEQYQPNSEDWAQLVAKIRTNPEVTEVILSGGDPLMLNDRRLNWIVTQLEQIPHLQTIRLHTRLPIVLPARITQTLVTTFAQSRCQIVLVSHANHGNEIDQEVRQAFKALQRAGVTLLNQSVLLREVNDSAEALIQLSKQLHSAGVLPYYLHLMDPVQGAQHFDVSESIGEQLIAAMRQQLPGYLVPRLARETPFQPAKTIIA